ncbi:transporter [Haloplanus sp. GCM10025708]|uniref:transporter n=1 Tax=Haloferacaceae TaxID=1644056 RepID=UPI0036098156
MAAIDTAVATIHLLFAGLWAGSVVFVALAVLPTATAGELNVDPLRTMASWLRTVSRASSLVLFLTGGHLAGAQYTVESLVGTTYGNLVIGMVALWLLLTGLVEAGTGRLLSGLDERKVRSPARSALPFFRAAALVACSLLVVGGIIV